MQRALFCTDPGNIPEGEWERLYFGSEFCSWTFPDMVSIDKAIDTARRQSLSFTLVTPVVSEPFLPRLEKTLSAIIPRLRDGDELVVSDLGTFSLVRAISPSVTMGVGRVLSGQKRGPRILDLPLTDDEVDYFRHGSWYQKEAVAFLREWGAHRVELDNLLQGLSPLPEGLSGTLHVPWAMVTSSRNCPYREAGQVDPCPGGCGEVMELTTDQNSVPLYQAGNTQFLRHDKLPDNLPTLGIDRVVEHLVLPR